MSTSLYEGGRQQNILNLAGKMYSVNIIMKSPKRPNIYFAGPVILEMWLINVNNFILTCYFITGE